MNNFAIGGAASSDLTNPSPVTGVSQFDQFTAAQGVNADPNALYVVLIGGNDFALYNPATMTPEFGANFIVGNISNFIDDLTAAGAQHFLILDLPALLSYSDVSVYGPGTEFYELYLVFNQILQDTFPNAMIFDSFNFFENILPNYLDINGNLGIDPGENAGRCIDDSVCLAAAPAGDSSAYLFFDNIHVTKSVHELFAEAVTAAVMPTENVPLPWFTLWCLAIALSGLAIHVEKR